MRHSRFTEEQMVAILRKQIGFGSVRRQAQAAHVGLVQAFRDVAGGRCLAARPAKQNIRTSVLIASCPAAQARDWKAGLCVPPPRTPSARACGAINWQNEARSCQMDLDPLIYKAYQQTLNPAGPRFYSFCSH